MWGCHMWMRLSPVFCVSLSAADARLTHLLATRQGQPVGCPSPPASDLHSDDAQLLDQDTVACHSPFGRFVCVLACCLTTFFTTVGKSRAAQPRAISQLEAAKPRVRSTAVHRVVGNQESAKPRFRSETAPSEIREAGFVGCNLRCEMPIRLNYNVWRMDGGKSRIHNCK